MMWGDYKSCQHTYFLHEVYYSIITMRCCLCGLTYSVARF